MALVFDAAMAPHLLTASLLYNGYRGMQRKNILGVDHHSGTSLVVNAAEPCATGDVKTAVAGDVWTQLHSEIAAHVMGHYISLTAKDLG
jgi:hypothetical protein